MGFQPKAEGKAGTVLRKLMLASNRVKRLATGKLRMPLLDRFGATLDSDDGKAILQQHMPVQKQVRNALSAFIMMLLLPLSPCLPADCRSD